jgi:hypothetical protein
MEIVKEYDKFKCVLKHDMNSEVLIMEMWKNNKVFFVSSVRNVQVIIFNNIAEAITEQESLSMLRLGMEVI